jgi:acetyl-CoA carboxylase biotin carboxyl carrier protein
MLFRGEILNNGSSQATNHYKNKQLHYSLTYEDVVEVFKMIDGYQYRHLNIELGDLKIEIDKGELNKAEENEKMKEISTPSVNQNNSVQETVDDLDPEQDIIYSQHKENDEVAMGKNEQSSTEDMVPVKASITGVFYKASSPDAEPFVSVGNEVKKGDELGLIEVMKLFNSIRAPCDGVVKEIYVENEGIVELDDVLMIIEPAQ